MVTQLRYVGPDDVAGRVDIAPVSLAGSGEPGPRGFRRGCDEPVVIVTRSSQPRR